MARRQTASSGSGPPWRLLLRLCLMTALLLAQPFNFGSTRPQQQLLCVSADKPTCKVVVYDQIKGYLNWLQDWFKKAALEQCETRNTLTEDKSQISSANVVLFHAPTHGKSGAHSTVSRGRGSKAGLSPKLPQQHPQQAVFAMFSMEQPK
jgi:hypothetical protein